MTTLPHVESEDSDRSHTVSGPAILEVTATVDEGTATVVVHGDIDSGSGHILTEAFDRQLGGEGVGRIRLDLSSTSFVDSSGLVTLLDLRAAAARVDVPLTLVKPSRAVRRLLELSELVTVFDLEA